MKKFLLFIKKNIITFLSVLIIFFLLSFMVVNNYNNNHAYYIAKVNITNIESVDIDKLNDASYLNSIKNDEKYNGKYNNIDVDKMLKNNDFKISVIDDDLTIKTLYKYYDVFFLGSINKTSNRAKTFIKDCLINLTNDTNKITYYNENVVELYNYKNGYIVSLITTSITLLILLIICFALSKKQKEIIIEGKEKINIKAYFKEAFKPIKTSKEIAVLAMLFSLMIISKFIPLPSGFGNLGLGFTYLFFAIACMIYGPFYGFIIGIFSDTIGFFIGNKTAAFSFAYTLQAAFTGMIYGFCFYKKKVSFKNALFARILVNILMNAIYGSFLFIFITYFSFSNFDFNDYLVKVKAYMLLLSLPKNLVYLLPQSLLLYYVIKVTTPILIRFNIVDKKYKNDNTNKTTLSIIKLIAFYVLEFAFVMILTYLILSIIYNDFKYNSISLVLIAILCLVLIYQLFNSTNNDNIK